MPVYLFFGDEDYTLENEIQSIKESVLQTSGIADITPLNYRVLDNPPLKDLIAVFKTQPMMFGDIIYKIKSEKYFLDVRKKYTLDDKEIKEFTDALDFVSERVHIILTAQTAPGDKKKPDARKKIYKAVQKSGIIKEFNAFKVYEDYKILPVLKQMCIKKELKANNEVLGEIIRLTGPSLRELDNVLEKLKLTAHPSNIITVDMAKDACKGSENIFLISDLAIKKEYSKALYEINALLSKTHYLVIFAALQNAFLKLTQTKIYAKSMSSFEIARKTGQHEYAVKKSIEKINNVSLSDMVRLKQNLTQAEYDVKTGTKDPICAFEYVFFNTGEN